MAVKLYKRLWEKNQRCRILTLVAVALVKARLTSREVSKYLGVASLTLSKALKLVED